MTTPLLKLLAKDHDDVQVVSAIVQDAIAPVCDMTYSGLEKNFVMVVHRLRREVESQEGLQRICCAINLQGIEKVQLLGINLSQQGRMLDLLAVIPESETITFIFAGEAKIRLQLGDWSMIVEDFGETWPAQCNPCHEQAAVL